MNRVFFYGTVELSSCRLMLSTGARVSVWLTNPEIVRKCLDAGKMPTLTDLAFLSVIIGTRGLSCAFIHQQLQVDHPWWSILALWAPRNVGVRWVDIVIAPFFFLCQATSQDLPKIKGLRPMRTLLTL